MWMGKLLRQLESVFCFSFFSPGSAISSGVDVFLISPGSAISSGVDGFCQASAEPRFILIAGNIRDVGPLPRDPMLGGIAKGDVLWYKPCPGK